MSPKALGPYSILAPGNILAATQVSLIQFSLVHVNVTIINEHLHETVKYT